MDGTGVSDFSIDRILSAQLGSKPLQVSPEPYLLRPPAPVPVPVPMPVPVPVPVPGYLQSRGMSFGDPFYPYGAGLRHSGFTGTYPNSGVHLNFSHESADAPPVSRCTGYHQAGASVLPLPRPKARMRTVFTHGQTQQLEALFKLTDYPTVEARAEVARNTGLSDETVRVWFKNRRARRKRSKVKPPPAPPSSDAAEKMFSCFL